MITTEINNHFESKQGLQDTTTVAAKPTIATDTVAHNTVETQETNGETPAADNGSGGNSVIGWISIVLILGLGVLFWHFRRSQLKASAKFKKDLDKLQCDLEENVTKLGVMENELSRIKSQLSLFSDKKSTYIHQAQIHGKEQRERGIAANDDHQLSTPNNKKKGEGKKVVKYGTLQMPDEKGTLRFSERSMNDNQSDQKMFRLELNQTTGSGTYHINEAATSLILSDLQLFQEYVKPFTFIGNPATTVVREKKAGTIVRNGTFWIVDTPLEVEFV